MESAYSPESEDTADSQPGSRQTSRSPAGNGRRLDDSSCIGSSSASAGVAAGHLRGGGLDSEETGAGMRARRTGAPGHLAGIGSPEDEETTDVEHDTFELDTEPPPYQDEGYEDEGFSGMTESIIGPINYNYNNIYGNNPVWGFAGIPIGGASGDADDDEDALGDAASDQPAMGDDPGDRLMQDFGDDVMNPGQNSRAMTPMSDEMPELVGNDGAVQVENMDMVGADDEVADVVVDEGDVGGGYAKMD